MVRGLDIDRGLCEFEWDNKYVSKGVEKNVRLKYYYYITDVNN